MKIKTKEFQTVANKILGAVGVDKNAANLGLKVENNALHLSVTNREFYVRVSFPLEETVVLNATVDATLFLNLISGITTEEFDLIVDMAKGNRRVVIRAGKSEYTLPMIMENADIMNIPEIRIGNKTAELTISNDILTSILNVNSKEVAASVKNKSADSSELRKLYYIDNTGCFTFTTGSACVNSFTLDKPVKILLNDRIVKLFKLFTSDVKFTTGFDAIGNMTQTKISFEADNIYVAAKITNDDTLIAKVERPCVSVKQLIADHYDNTLVLNVNDLSAAIARLSLFTKNSFENANSQMMPAIFKISGEELLIKDLQGNTEVVTIENTSFVENAYEMVLNLIEVKAIVDSTKLTHLTVNCGNGRSVVVVRGPISNVLTELKAV